MTSLQQQMRADLPAAIRARDAVLVSVLRTALAAVANAEAVPAAGGVTPAAFGSTEVPRRQLSEAEVRAIVVREQEDLRATADELHRRGRPTEATQLAAKADLLDGYLLR